MSAGHGRLWHERATLLASLRRSGCRHAIEVAGTCVFSGCYKDEPLSGAFKYGLTLASRLGDGYAACDAARARSVLDALTQGNRRNLERFAVFGHRAAGHDDTLLPQRLRKLAVG